MIPVPDTIPVNWWWFEVLLMVTFLLHVLLMNFVLGSSLIGVYSGFRGRSALRESSSLPTLIALSVNFGVPPLLFLQVLYGHLFYSSSILLGIPWLMVIPFLIVAYYAAYIFIFKRGVSPRFALANLVLSSLLLLFIGFMMTSNNTLMLRPEKWTLYFERPNGAGFNPGEPTLLPRYLHFVIASVAIGGLWKAIYHRFSRRGDEAEIKIGLRIFTWATAIQIVGGLWFLLSLPTEIMLKFLGNNILATMLLTVGVAIALLAIYTSLREKLIQTLIITVSLVSIMIVNRDILRGFYLEAVFSPSELVVRGEYGPLVLFLIAFLSGLVVIYYMISLVFKSKQGGAR